MNTLRQPILNELERYQQLFRQTLTHEDDFLGQALSHVASRQGKMMRPVLLLLVAKEFGPVSDVSVRAAVTLELLHTASLVHDDVVDNSAERRGQPAEHTLFGNKVAILVGDYMLSSALHQAALTGDMRIVDIIARLGGTLAEGEVRQLADIRQAVATEAAYFNIIRHKTAALFEACGRLGAISAGAPEPMVQTAALLGETIGTCFQIRDDIFDYFEDDAQRIGKPTASDMRDGKVTLPALYAASVDTTGEAAKLAAFVLQRTASDADVMRLVELTKQHGGIDYARDTMETYRRRARRLLDDFSNSEVRNALAAYVDFTIDRDR